MPLGVILCLWLVGQSGAELDFAEELYRAAQYEATAEKLGESCADSSDAMRCEVLRALVNLALGRHDLARAAFHRLLVLAPDATLPRDIPPKVRAMFDEAVITLSLVGALSLEVVRDDRGLALTVRQPRTLELRSVTAHVAVAGGALTPIPLAREGMHWSGHIDSGDTGDVIHANLIAILNSETPVTLGDAERGDRVPVAQLATLWPLWSKVAIGGGVIALVAGSVAIGFAASATRIVGSVRVGVEVR